MLQSIKSRKRSLQGVLEEVRGVSRRLREFNRASEGSQGIWGTSGTFRRVFERDSKDFKAFQGGSVIFIVQGWGGFEDFSGVQEKFVLGGLQIGFKTLTGLVV